MPKLNVEVKLQEIADNIKNVGAPTDSQATTTITNWLNAHPEATTTVQNGSVTEAKLATSLKKKIYVVDVVTPEQYGAVGDGTTDDLSAIENALATGKTVLLGEKTYYCSDTVVLEHEMAIKGTNKYTSVLKFPSGSNGVQLNHSTVIENMTIDFSGSGSALYVYTPDNYSYHLSTVAKDLRLIHSSDDINGSFIRLVAEKKNDTLPNGGYNILFDSIDARKKAKYGIEIESRVKTNAQHEAWFTDLKFENIFFDAVKAVLYSNWKDISGSDVAPASGTASVNENIKLHNISAQYVANVTERFAEVYNIRYLQLSNCTPFDYYILPDQLNTPIMTFNAMSNMCSVDLGWMPEFPAYTDMTNWNKYVEIVNTSDYVTDFKKVIRHMMTQNGTILGNFKGYDNLLISDFNKNKLTTMQSSYGSTSYGYLQIGNVVFLALTITPTGSVTIPADTNTLTSTLPVPIAQRGSVACDVYNTDGANVQAYVRWNGELRLKSALTTSNSITFTTVYMT